MTGHTISGTAAFNSQTSWAEFSVSANLAEDVARDLEEVLEKRRVETCLVSMEAEWSTPEVIILLRPALTIDPFPAWRPPLCPKDTAKSKNCPFELCLYGIRELW